MSVLLFSFNTWNNLDALKGGQKIIFVIQIKAYENMLKWITLVSKFSEHDQLMDMHVFSLY